MPQPAPNILALP